MTMINQTLLPNLNSVGKLKIIYLSFSMNWTLSSSTYSSLLKMYNLTYNSFNPIIKINSKETEKEKMMKIKANNKMKRKKKEKIKKRKEKEKEKEKKKKEVKKKKKQIILIFQT